MKIAYCIRKNWKVAHGGDVVQMLNTKAEIEKAYNVEIKIVDNINKLSAFGPDIVHIFNMQTIEESSQYLKEAKSIGAKTILSTIYWDMSHARFIVNIAKLGLFCRGENYKSLYNLYKNTESIIASIFGKPTSATKEYQDQVKSFLKDFDWYLPNSEEEMQIVNHVFDTKYENYSVIPNAVDFNKFPFVNNNMREGFITAARIEPIKNQLMLANIAKKNNFPLTMVGGINENDIDYINKIKEVIGEESYISLITKRVEQNILRELFLKKKVHVLTSFRESPGLSSLEALGSGMNLVVSEANYCPINTYFKNIINKHVFICDPYSEKSISLAMQKSHNSLNPEKNYIYEFNWSSTGHLTYEVYEKILFG